MAEKTKYYKELGLGRQRTLGLGYSLNGVPVDADHAALIEESIKEALERDRQEKNAAANQAKAASTPCRFPHQTRSSPTQGKRDFANPESSSTTDPGRNIGTANISDRVDLGRAIQIRDRDGPAEILPQNEWPVALIFNGNDYFEGKVLLDTGAADNWISERVIREKGISKEDDKDEDQFEDFNGRITKSSGVVRAIWLYRHQTINVKFRVAPQAPWEVLFGYRHLIETGVLTFHPEHNISFVAPLTKKDRTLSAGESDRMPSRISSTFVADTL